MGARGISARARVHAARGGRLVRRALGAAITAAASIALLGADARAQSGGGVMPVQEVAGKLVVACDLSTAAGRIPANLFIEVEGRHGLQLHNRAAAALRAESADGTPRPITLHFPDFQFTVPRRELGDEDLFEEFTKYHSVEIGENALVGSIGAEVLRDWIVTFDVGAGAVELAPPAANVTAPPSSTRVEEDGTIVAPLTLIDDMAWIPVRYDDGSPAGLMLGCGRYDTVVDERAARAMGRPAGDVGPVRIGGLDLSRYVAFRPEPVIQTHPDGVLGVTGLGLLKSLRITVDRERRTLRICATEPDPVFPAADLEYFRARADEDPDALAAWLERHGGRPDPEAEGDAADAAPERLAGEAAKLLLDYRVADFAPRDEIEDAVAWVADTVPADLRTTRMLDLMKEMADAGQDQVVLAAGELGIESGRDDRYPNAVHEVHGRLGRTLLDGSERRASERSGAEGDEAAAMAEDAWRHLLSAAFGTPEDGRVNYDLGRFYERQGRYRRAFSRYVQAVIKPEAGGLALEALQRVQPLLAAEDEDTSSTFSVDTIERMIAGKVRNFGASSRFEPSAEDPALRVVLAEFFTNGHLGNETRGGAIGGALGFEGLISHFGPDEVAFLEYHLPKPQPDALCSSLARARAAQLGVEDPTVIVLDGQQGSPGAGKWRDAEAIYTRARRAVLARLKEFGDQGLDVEATLEDGVVRGTAFVDGLDEDWLRLQVVLAEEGVLYPGGSGVVVHRWVARASMVGDDEGVPVTIDDDVVEVEFELSIDDAEEIQKGFLEQMEAEELGSAPRISVRMDPNQARVVAFLFDERNGRVLAAASCVPDGVEGEDAEVEVMAPIPGEGGR